VAVLDRFLFLIRQNATSPPIRARPTKPPTIAAIVPIFLSEGLPGGTDVYEGETEIPLAVVDGGGPSDLSVLLAMFISKISMPCTARSAVANVTKRRIIPKRLDKPICAP
jgi:hypothetical protein